jgi:replicative DNA helicase
MTTRTINDGSDGRPLPHNLDAERSILGAIIADNKLFDRVQPRVCTDDFFREGHQLIYQGMQCLFERGAAVDFVTLKEELHRQAVLDKVGGPVYVAQLSDGVPRATNVDYYAGIVCEKALLRGLIEVATKLRSDAYAAEETASELLTKADMRLLDLRRGHRGKGASTIGSGMVALMADLEHPAEHKGEVFGLPTGYTSIDDLLCGWQPGELTLIAARPSIGKTTFTLNSGVHVAVAGKRVLVVSLEMKRRQLEDRTLSQLSRVPATRILTGFLGALDYSKISEAFERMHGLPLVLDDRSGLTVADIRAQARRVRNEGGLDLLIVDYVQLVKSGGKFSNRNEEMTDISRRFKELADELTVPILLVSQLSRANEKRADPRPRLSDLRESGALEQDADNVCFLHRENHRAGGTTEFIVKKQRNGPTGTMMLKLDRDTVTFAEADTRRAEQPASAPLPGMEKTRKGLRTP